MSELVVTSGTAADATFSSSGATAWNAGMTASSGQLSAARGGTGLDTSASTGLASISGGTWSVSTVGTGVLTALGVAVGSAGAFVTNGGALGTPSSGTLTNATGLPEGGLALTDITTNDVSATKHGFAPKFPNNTTTFLRGDGTYAAPTASASLSGISAASASNTIANGNNTGQIWNWANTTDSTTAFTFGETSAATSGTLTGGLSNQRLLTLSTLAASTQSPLTVIIRGTLAMQAASTTTQIKFANGTAAAPVITNASNNGGIHFNQSSNGDTSLDAAGVELLRASAANSQVFITKGLNNAPSLTDITTQTTGFYWPSGVNVVAVSDSTSNEIFRFVGGTANVRYTTRAATTFANLPAAANGSELYCSDCDAPTLVDSTCTSAGAKTGAMAARVNATWKCYT